jgi:uncharacterized membrane protein
MEHEERIVIDAGVATVWQVLADVERWPEWTSSVRSVELLDGALAVGGRVRIRQPKFPPVVWEVTELAPGTAFTWVSRTPGARAVGRHELLDGGDGTTTAVLTISQTGPVGTIVGLVTRGLTRRYVALEAKGLKDRSEQEHRRGG